MQRSHDAWLRTAAERLWRRRALYVRHFVTGFVFGVAFSSGPFGG